MELNLSPVSYETFRDQLECTFCSPPEDEVLLETPTLFVTCDAAPISEGHILLHSKAHYPSAGDMPRSMLLELEETIAAFADVLEPLYGTLTTFEHGRTGHCDIASDGSDCDHMHVHLVPVETSVRDWLTSRHQSSVAPHGLLDVPRLAVASPYYLYYRHGDDPALFLEASEDLAPHYLRTVLCAVVGRPERADWKSAFSKEEVNGLKERLLHRSRPTIAKADLPR